MMAPRRQGVKTEEKKKKNPYSAVSFAKKTKCLMKKAAELSTLCGVDLCVVVSPPSGAGSVGEFETWPPSASQSLSILRRYAAVRKGADSAKKKAAGEVQSSMSSRVGCGGGIGKEKEEEEEVFLRMEDESGSAAGTSCVQPLESEISMANAPPKEVLEIYEDDGPSSSSSYEFSTTDRYAAALISLEDSVAVENTFMTGLLSDSWSWVY